ncbi:MAG: hypothetical protein CMD22_06390, partial [Flavobacteriales bacterium]|nr:hypothetical protein [Flavobacteriales bacterium]
TSLKDIITRWKNIVLSIIFLIVSNANANAQYEPNQEFGILGGTGYYIGDLNNTHFNNIRAAGGITFRKNFDRRFSFKSCILYTNVYADDAKSSDNINKNRNLHFKSDVIELSGQVEFNFLPYETGNSLYPFTPFVFTGVSLFNFNPRAEASDGQWYALQELGTEGQGTTAFPNRKKYALTQMSIPFGGGVKIGVSDDVNIILEYGLRKTFTDYIDDVSTTYAGLPSEFDNITIELSDRSLDGPQQAGIARGDETNKDWYSFAGVTLSFRLKGNTKGCDY